MILKKLNMWILSVLLCGGLANHSAHASGTINIAVAANFYTTLGIIVQNFLNSNPGNTINVTPDSSGVLYNTIVANNGVNTYDMFLSADKKRPDDLVSLHPTLVVSGTEWLYAVGELEFWSPSINVSAGVVYPLTQNLVLANPSTAPYGTAAATVLNTISGGVIAYPPLAGTTYPNGAAFVNVRANISLTKSAITSTGSIKEGFIHQSSICTQSGSTKTFTGSHHTYAWNDPTYPHAKIAQYGIQLVNSARPSGSGSDTLLTNFRNYLGTTSAQNVIKGYCYATTL
ncbi:substrate-binding domain-containing protein [Methylovulum miyakonense]|uniref:substrate-binding domain-containing protein n=1 Tax=Methylovulum miyakonense TaxID=645578 RepID=UPI00037AB86C|nr:substrate-binding domain-containing protein [Methylovulum miyakonense]